MGKTMFMLVNFVISGFLVITIFRFYGKNEEEAAIKRKKLIGLIFVVWISLFAVMYIINQFIL